MISCAISLGSRLNESVAKAALKLEEGLTDIVHDRQ